MSVVLYCGFRLVRWGERFRPSSKAKGSKLCEAEHVFDVREEVGEAGKSSLFGLCVPQTKIRNKGYGTLFPVSLRAGPFRYRTDSSVAMIGADAQSMTYFRCSEAGRLVTSRL